jgi:hypothetical protein
MVIFPCINSPGYTYFKKGVITIEKAFYKNRKRNAAAGPEFD